MDGSGSTASSAGGGGSGSSSGGGGSSSSSSMGRKRKSRDHATASVVKRCLERLSAADALECEQIPWRALADYVAMKPAALPADGGGGFFGGGGGGGGGGGRPSHRASDVQFIGDTMAQHGASGRPATGLDMMV